MVHNRDVVTPGWVRDIDFLSVRVKCIQERSTNAKSTSTRDTLGNGKLKETYEYNEMMAEREIRLTYAVFLDHRAFITVSQTTGSLGEFWHTGNASILLVKLFLQQDLLGLTIPPPSISITVFFL